MIMISAILLLVAGGSPAPPTQKECTAEIAALEAASTSSLITATRWRAFRGVARLRLKSGLEVLPGMIGCPDFTDAAAELKSDPATRAALRRAGLSPVEYVQTGWALLVANDPETFRVGSSAVMRSNVAFIAKHRAEVDSLLSGR